MAALKIIIFGTITAVAYGIVHDLVTTRISIEYFTIGHPILLVEESATLMALQWGIVATWWVGLGLGIGCAIACRIGRWPKLTVTDIIRPTAFLLIVMGLLAILSGLAVYLTGGLNTIVSVPHRLPENRRLAFEIASSMHLTSYIIGFVGGLRVVLHLLLKRRALSRVPAKEAC